MSRLSNLLPIQRSQDLLQGFSCSADSCGWLEMVNSFLYVAWIVHPMLLKSSYVLQQLTTNEDLTNLAPHPWFNAALSSVNPPALSDVPVYFWIFLQIFPKFTKPPPLWESSDNCVGGQRISYFDEGTPPLSCNIGRLIECFPITLLF